MQKVKNHHASQSYGCTVAHILLNRSTQLLFLQTTDTANGYGKQATVLIYRIQYRKSNIFLGQNYPSRNAQQTRCAPCTTHYTWIRRYLLGN